jgi:tRNA U55 pseudouridine synthase TruB
MKTREITILSIEIISYSYPDLFLKATVSAGTYIRSIAVDL